MTFRTPTQISRQAQNKKGFTLTEIAIVLGIIGLILGAIWVAASSVYANQKIAHANTAILQITQGVRSLYATSSSTGTVAQDLTQNLITANVIPTDIRNSTNTGAIDPWAGGTTAVTTPASGDSFTVEMTAVPQAACISLLSNIGGASRDPGLFGVDATSAGTANVKKGTAGTAIPTAAGQVGVISIADATAGCSNATSNLIQFGFSLK